MKFAIIIMSLFTFSAVTAEQMLISFDEVVHVTPFQSVVEQCMRVHENLAQGELCQQLMQLHVACVRMHDARVPVLSEDTEYLCGWFDHLGKQLQDMGACSCLNNLLEQSRQLVV